MAARVVLAMSGGVDSSVAAFLLKQQGYDVIGLFMRTGVHEEGDSRQDHKKGCCSARDASDAQRVADKLDIPFYALDFEGEFNRIIDYFSSEYLTGRTPNPCVVCNSWLKFGQLWAYGQQIEADFIATGHYAQILNPGKNAELHRAADPDKDQSYVLYGIQKSILPHLLFPIGGYRKPEIRTLAREAGLGVADKPDSVEICFVPDGDHAALIRRRNPQAQTQGHFVDRDGEILGDHAGFEQFTIGQRKGLGVAMGDRRYVLKIIPQTNDVVLGSKEDLLAQGLEASQVNWLTDFPSGPIQCDVKIRYRHTPTPARIIPRADRSVEVTFVEPQFSVTPGQAVVFYQGTQVLGGGWIESALGSR